MELAVNQFTKGLLCDTNPMVQGNDTLSDALNGTFITMNGNEVILQNDMGNRRVNNAYLPSGYTPVGIKEYGGIIYIAAYNPITNKSQIGSFPSPERKMSSEDGLGGTLNLNLLIETYQDNNLANLPCISKDTILIPLTKDTSLHAGDKFVVYGDLSEIKDNLTNYNNTTSYNISNYSGEDISYSPKNKLYTLSLGILNSQNEFVDITKTLNRWDKSKKIIKSTLNSSGTIVNTTSYETTKGIIEYDNEIPDFFKFNDGYFIASELSNVTLDNTLSDKKLIQARLALPTNTYAYKLVGPLYLLAKLNHIKEFNYNIYGIKKDNNVTLWVEAYLIYNCPDGITENSKVSDSNYYTYEEGKILPYSLFSLDTKEEKEYIPGSTGGIFSYKSQVGTISPTVTTGYNSPIFDLYSIKDNNILDKLIEVNFDSTTTKYDSTTNLYSCKIIKEYNVSTEENEYNYILGVRATVKDNIYLQGLSVKGSIDFSLLGSGTVTLTGWRFYNNYDNLKATLTYTFDAYPKYGESFNNLIFTFTNVLDSADTFTINGTIYNGRNTIEFYWKNSNTLYKVTWKYDVIGNTTETIDSENNTEKYQKDRWFLTTDLFNSCYNPNSSDYILDYGTKPLVGGKCNVICSILTNAKDRSGDSTTTLDKNLIGEGHTITELEYIDWASDNYTFMYDMFEKGMINYTEFVYDADARKTVHNGAAKYHSNAAYNWIESYYQFMTLDPKGGENPYQTTDIYKQVKNDIETNAVEISKLNHQTYIWTTSKSININLNPTIELNSKLYPSYVKLSGNKVNINNVKASIEGEIEWNDQLNKDWIEKPSVDVKFNPQLIDGNIIGELKNYDVYQALQISDNTTVEEYFISTSDFIDLEYTKDSTYDNYLNRVEIFTQGGYEHKLVIYGKNYDSSSESPWTELERTDGYWNTIWNYDSKGIYHDGKSSTVQENISEYINKYAPSDLTIIFGKVDETVDSLINDALWYTINDTVGIIPRYTVWWRSTDGIWAIVANTMKSGIDVLKKLFPNNTIFSAYTNIKLSDVSLYKPSSMNYRKTDKYSIPCTISCDLSVENPIIINNPECSFDCEYPVFTAYYSNNKITSGYSYEVVVNSSEKYLNDLNSYIYTNNIPVYSIYGDKDKDGNSLNSSNFYQYDGEKLSSIKLNFKISEKTGSKERTLLYKPTLYYNNMDEQIEYQQMKSKQSSNSYTTQFLIKEQYYNHIIFPYDTK